VFLEGVDEDLIQAMSRLMSLPFVRVEKLEGVLPDIICTPQGDLHRILTGEKFPCATREDLLMGLIALSCIHLLATTDESIIHAGAFVVEGRAVLFCGPHLMGKSSLAYTAWKLSYPVIGDDWIVVDPLKRTASAFPKPIKTRFAGGVVSPDIEPTVPPQDRLVGRLMSGEYRLVLGKGLENMTPLGQEFPVGALYLMARGKDERTVIEVPSRHDALATILEETMLTRTSRLRVIKLLAHLRQGQRVYRIVVGENDLPRAVKMMADKASASLQISTS
jgi:hypothetical protein